jgi:glycosyltransferase 2 family protein
VTVVEAPAGGTDRNRPRRRLWFALKVVFSLSVLIYIILKKAPLVEIGRALGGVRLSWVLIAFVLSAVGLLISAYRWQILGRAQGDEMPLAFLAKSHLVGLFFSQFLPTSFGGDIVRIFDGSRYSRSLLKSSAIVAVERGTGLAVLFLFALVASLFRIDMARQIPFIWVSLALGAGGLAAVAVYLLPVSGRWLSRLPDRGWLGKTRDKVAGFRAHVLEYARQPGPFLLATAWAFILQVNVVVYYYLIGLAFGLTIPFLDYFIIIPIVLLVQILPVTINGLGLREGAYVALFAAYGISAGTAVSYSVVDVALRLVVATVGGLVYMARR